MAKEIKQRIVLEGEKEYRQALKEAQRNLKTLKSELKAETAELGKNATEQQKNEAKLKSLKKQIQEQEKVVSTYRKALEEVREKYGDNEDAIARYEQQLNNARATLAGMKNELDSVGDGFRQVDAAAAAGTVATKSFADSVGKIGDVGETVASAIEGIFSGMVNTVQEAITAVWDDMMELAYRANAWSDIAGFWNTDTATIQKWSYAVQSATGDFDDLQNAVSRINMGDAKKIAEASGVSSVNYQNDWDYAMAVMDALAGMDHAARNNAAGEIFGEKRATKVMDLLNDWKTITDKLARYDVNNGGIGMTEEQMADMSELAEKVDTLKATWDAFKSSFEAGAFGKLALDLTGNAQRILDDLIKFVDTGDDSDLKQLEKDIEEFFERIKQALEAAAGKLDEAGKKLEESDNGIVRSIGKAMQGLASALEWLSKEENIDKVIAGFDALAAFWVVGKGVKLISSITELAANLRVISSFSALSGAAGAAGSAAGGAAGGTLLSTIGAALAKIVIPVSLAAITCGPLLQRLIQGKTPEQEEMEKRVEDAKDVGEQLKEAGVEAPSRKETAEALWNLVWTGSTGHGTNAEEASRPAIGDGNGVPSPVPRARFDLTEEQREAAEAFWDVFRKESTDEEWTEAYEALKATFDGNESTFNRLNEWLDRLYEALGGAGSAGLKNQTDLPATWWKNPGTSGDAVTGSDLRAFNGLPAAMQAAVKRGAADGVSGLRVSMDGYAVGRIVAPYVSEMIARDIT